MTAQTASLFSQGYKVRAGKNANELLVRKPDASATYVINPVTRCCSCPATVVCKHIKQIESLVTETWNEINDSPVHAQRMFDLMVRWEQIRQSCKIKAEAAAAQPVAVAYHQMTTIELELLLHQLIGERSGERELVTRELSARWNASRPSHEEEARADYPATPWNGVQA